VPSLRRVAAECRVGKDFVAKIERELIENDRVLPPEEIYMACVNPIGPGSRSMSGEDFYVLYILYRQQPTRSLKICVLVTLLHGDDRVGEYRVAVVSPRLPDSRPALCA
jgi:hypothetical protein